MGKFKKYLISVTILFSLLFTLSTCKKYPENTLWFKNPEKTPVLRGFITKYEVNGIDSLDLLNKFFGSNTTLINRNIRESEFNQYVQHGVISGVWGLGSSCNLDTYQYFLDKGKKIKLGYFIDTVCYNKNIFVSSDQIWDILHFPTNKNPYFKIKTISNNNLITIQLN